MAAHRDPERRAHRRRRPRRCERPRDTCGASGDRRGPRHRCVALRPPVAWFLSDARVTLAILLVPLDRPRRLPRWYRDRRHDQPLAGGPVSRTLRLGDLRWPSAEPRLADTTRPARAEGGRVLGRSRRASRSSSSRSLCFATDASLPWWTLASDLRPADRGVGNTASLFLVSDPDLRPSLRCRECLDRTARSGAAGGSSSCSASPLRSATRPMPSSSRCASARITSPSTCCPFGSSASIPTFLRVLRATPVGDVCRGAPTRRGRAWVRRTLRISLVLSAATVERCECHLDLRVARSDPRVGRARPYRLPRVGLLCCLAVARHCAHGSAGPIAMLLNGADVIGFQVAVASRHDGGEPRAVASRWSSRSASLGHHSPRVSHRRSSASSFPTPCTLGGSCSSQPPSDPGGARSPSAGGHVTAPCSELVGQALLDALAASTPDGPDGAVPAAGRSQTARRVLRARRRSRRCTYEFYGLDLALPLSHELPRYSESVPRVTATTFGSVAAGVASRVRPCARRSTSERTSATRSPILVAGGMSTSHRRRA